MRYLYYCNSAYQIMAAINLHWNRKNKNFEHIDNYDGDLIILNRFSGAQDIATNIINNNLFSNTYFVNKILNNGRFHFFNSVINTLMPNYYLKKHHHLDNVKNRYDVIVVPKYSLLMDSIYRVNKKAKLQYYEDGMAAYFSSSKSEPRSKSYELLRSLFGLGNDFTEFESLYLDKPELYVGEYTKKLKKIPDINEELLKVYKTVFTINIVDNNKDIYWIAQNLENDDYKKLVNRLLDILKKNANQVIFRPHPRYPDAFDTKGFAIDESNDAWEVKVLNTENIENKLLISVHSTACFTPKMLFDTEPYIILFYKLFDQNVSYVNDNFEKMMRKFINSYNDKEKIMVPTTIEQFEEYINKYLYIKKGANK